MFNLGDRVILKDFGDYTTGIVEEICPDPVYGTWYLVYVYGYSDTYAAKAINSLGGKDHGYVPFLYEHMELANV